MPEEKKILQPRTTGIGLACRKVVEMLDRISMSNIQATT